MAAEPGQWSNEAWIHADDADLLALTREGSSEAFAELWRRHLPAAYSVASRYKGRAAAEDVVADASLRVYQLLQAGKGPQTHFRSYFLTTVKTVAVDSARRDLRLVPTEDDHLEVLTGTEEHHYEAIVDQGLVRTAFQSLSERDQQVLWHTSVEGHSPSAVAEVMGMSPNGVSVTALRAKDALRARYLDAHAERAIARADSDECRWVMERMGRYVRGKLPRRQHLRVEEHIDECAHARALALEMTEVNRALPALIVPLIFMAACGSGHVVVAGLASAAAGAAGSSDGSSGSSSASGAAGPAGAVVVAPGLAAAVGVSSAASGMPGGGSSASGAGGAGAGAAGAAAVGGVGAVSGVAAAGAAGAASAGAGAGAGGAALGAASMAASILGKTAAVVAAAGLGAAFVASPTGQAALANGPMGSTSPVVDGSGVAGPAQPGAGGQSGSSQPGASSGPSNPSSSRPGGAASVPATSRPPVSSSTYAPAYPVQPVPPRWTPRTTPRSSGTWAPPITTTLRPPTATTVITKTTLPATPTTKPPATMPTKTITTTPTITSTPTTTTPTTSTPTITSTPTTTTPTTSTPTVIVTTPPARYRIEAGSPVRIWAPDAVLVTVVSTDLTNLQASGSGWMCSDAADEVGAIACVHTNLFKPAGELHISGRPTTLRGWIVWADGGRTQFGVQLG